jgi:hypothetical protein
MPYYSDVVIICISNLIAYGYPFYCSVKVIESKSKEGDTQW